MMKIHLFIFASVLFCINSGSAESIYECSGIIQNKPCKDNQKGSELTNLPQLSRYSGNQAAPSGDTDTIRARPKGDIFDVPLTDTAVKEKEQTAVKSAVRGKGSEDLVSRAEKLKLDLSSGRISMPEAEAESIRLRVLHDTLCTKQAATYDPRWDDVCRKSADNIQVAVAEIRDAKRNL